MQCSYCVTTFFLNQKKVIHLINSYTHSSHCYMKTKQETEKSFYPDCQALPSEYLFWHIFTHVIAEITNWVNETIVKNDLLFILTVFPVIVLQDIQGPDKNVRKHTVSSGMSMLSLLSFSKHTFIQRNTSIYYTNTE